MKIKQYFNQVDLPSNIPYEHARSSPLPEAIEGFAGGIQHVGKAVEKFVKEKNELDESLQAATLFNEARKRTREKEIEFAKEPNEVTHVSNVKESLDEIVKETMGKATLPNVRSVLAKAFADFGADRMNAAQDFAFKIYLAKSAGAYTKELFNFQQAYLETPDGEERSRISGEAEALIKSVATKLGRNPEEDWIVWKRETASGAVKSDMVVDPAGTLKKLESGQYVNLWNQDRPTLIREAKIMVKAAEVEAEKVRIDEETKNLMRRFGNDFEGMFKSLRDPAYLDERKLTAPEAHSIEIMISQKQQGFMRERQTVYHKTGQNALVLFQKHGLSEGQIASWVAKDELTEEQGRVWLGALEVQKNATAPVKTDDVTFINRFNEIKAAAGDITKLMDVRTKINADASGGLLAREAFVQLYNLTEEENNAVFKDPYFKMTDEYFKQQLGWQGGIVGAFLDKTGMVSQAYFTAQLELIKAIKEEKLTGTNIFAKGVSILIPHRTRMMNLIMGGPAEPPKIPTSPMVTKEAAPEVKMTLPNPKEFYGQYGSKKLLRDKTTGKTYKTDGKTWWEMK